MKGVHALIDTGAGVNAIDRELARQLGLPAMEEGEISGFHGRAPATFYLARLYVPDLRRLLFERFAGGDLKAGEQAHRLVLGRPFLRRYRMTYEGYSGQVEILEP